MRAACLCWLGVITFIIWQVHLEGVEPILIISTHSDGVGRDQHVCDDEFLKLEMK